MVECWLIAAVTLSMPAGTDITESKRGQSVSMPPKLFSWYGSLAASHHSLNHKCVAFAEEDARYGGAEQP